MERTFSWIDQNRRMSKDYEKLCETSEAFVYLAMSRLTVRRLARLVRLSYRFSTSCDEQGEERSGCKRSGPLRVK